MSTFAVVKKYCPDQRIAEKGLLIISIAPISKPRISVSESVLDGKILYALTSDFSHLQRKKGLKQRKNGYCRRKQDLSLFQNSSWLIKRPILRLFYKERNCPQTLS
jgi:hypothetical protein